MTKTNSGIILSTETKPLINWCCYSSVSKLVRHLEWILKLKRCWIQWKRGTKKREDFSRLSVSELQQSRDILVRLPQMESYPTEYKAFSYRGAWESLIKTVKISLKTITLDRVFTEEALYTFLSEIELIVSQRPLPTISGDIRDYDVLTPNHFIIGETNTNLTISQFDNSQINYRKKWKNIHPAINMLWNRWRKEYLPTLTQSKKGLVHNTNFKSGDLVIINEFNVPRSYWFLGRIIETFPGQDRVARSVKVKTPNNEFIRPANKLYLLEASD